MIDKLDLQDPIKIKQGDRVKGIQYQHLQDLERNEDIFPPLWSFLPGQPHACKHPLPPPPATAASVAPRNYFLGKGGVGAEAVSNLS